MLKRLVKRSFWITCLGHVVTNHATAWRYSKSNIQSSSGTTHSRLNTAASVKYIRDVFNDYKQYAGLTRFSGRVAEIGPGDNCGVALLFLNDGCESVDLLDRYYSRRDPVRHAKVYGALLREHPRLQARYGTLDLARDDRFDGVRWHHGPTAAGEEFFLEHRGYDSIVSRAVLEHLFDPILCLRRMAMALNEGGIMLHKVDLRDHGMFSTSFHELKYLEVPDRLYVRMTQASGKPNRVLIDAYRAELKRAGLEFQLLVTRLAGVGDIIPHMPLAQIALEKREKSLAYVRSVRHRFARSLKSLSDEDLAIAGIFIVARRM